MGQSPERQDAAAWRQETARDDPGIAGRVGG